MLRVYRSNRLEKLADVLADALLINPPPPMMKEWIVVSNLGMRVWLQRALSNRLGIACGIDFPFQGEVLDAICIGEQTENASVREAALTLALFELLPEMVKNAGFDVLERYLDGDERGQRRLGLSAQIAHVFAEYVLYRPEMVLRWEAGEGRDWQARLFREVSTRIDFRHIAQAAVDFLRRSDASADWPFSRLFFFAEPSFPPLYLAVLRTLSSMMDVHLFSLSPSSEWWGDISAQRRLFLEGIPGLEEEEMAEMDNPFLTTFGKIGRDFQWLLEETVAYQEHPDNLYCDPLVDSPRSAVHTIQSDILNLRFGPREDALTPIDDTVRIVSCHGPEREVEVLKDQLLDLFEHRPGLSSDDVLVMAPDLSPYVPFISAVFGAGPDRIPFNMTEDAGLAGQVVRGFAAILALLDSRLTVGEVFDVLSLEPVRSRFDLSEQAVLDAETWITEAGVRWGMDADHRAAFGQPRFEENTWRFGIDRLLLGVALDADEVALFEQNSPCGALPQDRARDLGNLVQFLETLFEAIRMLGGTHPIDTWVSRFEEVLGKLFTRTPKFEAGYERVMGALDELKQSARLARQEAPVAFQVVHKLLPARLEGDETRKGWRPVGVTFSDFVTMRAVPFKVIALLGMNEGVFPRRRQPPGFDYISHAPRLGDRQVTHDDRYRFLETLLSVRDTLILSYEGQSTKDNTQKSPSVVISELAENLERCFDTSARPLTVQHPLQPFGLPYFVPDSDPRLFSYNPVQLAGAESRLRTQTPKPFFASPLKSEATEQVIPLDRLLRFYHQPALDLLYHELGMRFPRGKEAVETREPIQRGGPEEWLILDALVRQGSEGKSSRKLFALFRAAGLLPHGTAGQIRFDRLRTDAAPLVDAVLKAKTGEPLGPVDVDVTAQTDEGPVRIVGALDGVWPSALLSYGYVPLSGRSLLRLWIAHLVLCAMDRPDLPETSILIGRQNSVGVAQVSLVTPATEPEVLLADLVTLYRAGTMRPLRLLPNASYEFVKHLENRLSPEEAKVKVRSYWNRRTESGDPRLQLAFRNTDLFGADPLGAYGTISMGFDHLAERVFGPMLDAMEKGVR